MPIRLEHTLTLGCMMVSVIGCQPGPEPEPPSGSASAHFAPTEITLKEVAETGLKELLDHRLTFTDSSGRNWTAPRGTLTDGASVPRCAKP